MIRNYEKQLAKIEKYITGYFIHPAHNNLYFHNLEHTRSVVKAADKIAKHNLVEESDLFLLKAAAWFIDTGYLENTDESPIILSARLAKEHLEHIDIQAAISVHELILSIVNENPPGNLSEQILADALCFYWGKKSFHNDNLLLKKENGLLKDNEPDVIAWLQETIELLEGRQYYTAYCRSVLQKKKDDNLRRLKDDLKNELHPAAPATAPEAKKDSQTEKSIDTMFKIATSNSQRISAMGDNKAHILITVNSIILSAIISLVLRKLEDNAYLIVPSFMLMAVSLSSMIFSILATRPSVPHDHMRNNDADEEPVDMLFFGSLNTLQLEHYKNGMHKMMENKEFLYSSLIKFVYTQGAVLRHKYRLLRWAYTIFMFGLVIAVLAFIIAALIHQHNVPLHPPGPR